MVIQEAGTNNELGTSRERLFKLDHHSAGNYLGCISVSPGPLSTRVSEGVNADDVGDSDGFWASAHPVPGRSGRTGEGFL